MKTSGANGLSRYRRRTASEWRELISRFESTGQTRKDFCLSQGVSLSTFDLWRRKLRGRTAEHSESMFVEVSQVEPNAVLHPGLCRSGFLGLFLIERGWIAHIGPSSSESWA